MTRFRLGATQEDRRYLQFRRVNGREQPYRIPEFEHEAWFESEDGTIAWDELPPGRWFVQAFATGGRSSSLTPLTVEGPSPSIELTVAKGIIITGTVLSPGGRAVPNAIVSWDRRTPAPGRPVPEAIRGRSLRARRWRYAYRA